MPILIFNKKSNIYCFKTLKSQYKKPNDDELKT